MSALLTLFKTRAGTHKFQASHCRSQTGVPFLKAISVHSVKHEAEDKYYYSTMKYLSV